MIILGNYKNNYDIATKTAQWVLTPKQLNLVFCFFEALPNGLNKPREAITKILVFRFGSSWTMSWLCARCLENVKYVQAW